MVAADNKFLFATATDRSQTIGNMKYKLLALLAASLTLLSCGQDKQGSSVADSIAPVVQKFDGEKYTATEIAGNPDYYILYFTASW